MIHAALAHLLDAIGRKPGPAAPSGDTRRYRLRTWPELPDPLRVAPIYRILSTMSVQPVTRGWMEMQPGVQRGQLRSLLDFLERGHALA